MRLTKKEISKIKQIIYTYLGDDSKIYIFGSRLENNKKGGDIDIFVKTNNNDISKRLLTKAKLKQALFKPIDLIVNNNDFEKLIKKVEI